MIVWYRNKDVMLFYVKKIGDPVSVSIACDLPMGVKYTAAVAPFLVSVHYYYLYRRIYMSAMPCVDLVGVN